jgi:nicotinamide riboside transporter PnuC
MTSNEAFAQRTALRTVSRLLRLAAVVVAVHGLVLVVFGQVQALWPDLAVDMVGEALFFLLALPALLLTAPFTALLWRLGLMNAPGWFAWPKPAGVALAYAGWIAGLLVLSQLARLAARPRAGSGATPSGGA